MSALQLYLHDALCEVVFAVLPGWMIRCNNKCANAVYVYFGAGAYRWGDASIGVAALGLPTRLAVYRWYEREGHRRDALKAGGE